MSTMIQYVLYLAILVVLAIPLGAYIKNVMSGEKTFLSKVLTPCENLIYKVMRVDREEQMTWKKYAVSVMIFSGIGLVFLFLLQLLQGVLPGNPQNLSGVKWDLAFNTSASFITNTNWQAYSGESTLSYLTQALGLTVQNFVSAATGIAVLFALIRGFIKVKSSGLGSFWVDLTRIVVHILLPLNLVISLLLVGGGVIQNLKSAETVSLVEPIAVSAEGEILEDAVIDLDTETVTVDGEIVSNAQIVTEQFVPMGPAASQVAIKQTGTNGGGYMGVNSAHPLENSNAFTNLIENAIKYNREEGKVWVTLDADHKFFYVKVEDNGVGIPKEFQERVFERFYRVDKARSRETGGTGLGLAITKNIILLHQGAIRLKSEEGKGATFTVRIPLNYIP